MGVYFKCNDSCGECFHLFLQLKNKLLLKHFHCLFFSIDLFAVTSQQMVSESKSMAHKARDLRLVTTLEIRKNFKMEIIQRK